MSKFEWQEDRHSLQKGAMDSAHKEFVTLVNQLSAASDAEEIAKLDVLLAHCEDHFGQEQHWMESSQLPSPDNHLRDHDGVLALLRSTRTDLVAGKFGTGREVADSLAVWFHHHAETMDAALALHMQQSVRSSQGGIPAVG